METFHIYKERMGDNKDETESMQLTHTKKPKKQLGKKRASG